MNLREQLTIPSRDLEVWRRLYGRYSLEPRPASVVPDVSKTIVPVTQADALLIENGRRFNSTVHGAGISTFEIVFIVADGERLSVQVLTIQRVAGDNEWDTVQLLDGSVGGTMNFDVTANQNTQTFRLGTELILEQGDAVRVLFNGTGVAATTINTSLWCGIQSNF